MKTDSITIAAATLYGKHVQEGQALGILDKFLAGQARRAAKFASAEDKELLNMIRVKAKSEKDKVKTAKVRSIEKDVIRKAAKPTVAAQKVERPKVERPKVADVNPIKDTDFEKAEKKFKTLTERFEYLAHSKGYHPAAIAKKYGKDVSQVRHALASMAKRTVAAPAEPAMA